MTSDATRRTGRRAGIRREKPPMWDERFSSTEYVYGTEPNEFLRTAASRIPPGRVLSLADGEGRNGVFLATLGYDVTSVDASAVGLRKARQLAATRGVRLTTVVADLADFEIAPGAWQGIVSIFCHLPPTLRRSVHARVVRGLAPGGVFEREIHEGSLHDGRSAVVQVIARKQA